MSDRDILRESRKWAAGDAGTWHQRSQTLIEAARRLAAPFQEAYSVFQGNASEEERLQAAAVLSVSPVHLMLCGLALELLFKARLAAQGRGVLDDNETLVFPFIKHDLELLAREANVPLTDGQRHLLQRLTAFAVWAGRYPIARKVEAHFPVDIPDGGRAPINHIRSGDMEAIAALYSHVEGLPI